MSSNPKRIPHPQLLPSPQHIEKCNLVFFSLLNVCCWQYWRCLFLQAMGQCGAAFVYFVPQPIFPRSSPTPSSFPLTSSAWDLFAQTLSDLVFLYQHTMAIMCHTCIQPPTSLGKLGTRLTVVFSIFWLLWFIPFPAHCPGILVFDIPHNRDSCQANVYRDQWPKTSS